MPFKSKAQQRWAFGTGQSFARRWAKNTKKSRKGGLKSLPEKKKKRK